MSMYDTLKSIKNYWWPENPKFSLSASLPPPVEDYFKTFPWVRATSQNQKYPRVIGRYQDTLYAADVDGKLFRQRPSGGYVPVNEAMMFRDEKTGIVRVFDTKSGSHLFRWPEDKNLLPKEVVEAAGAGTQTAPAKPPETSQTAAPPVLSQAPQSQVSKPPSKSSQQGGGLLDGPSAPANNAPIAVLGKGALANKAALTPEVVDILNRAMKDKNLTAMADNLKSGSGDAGAFLQKLFERITDATREKDGRTNTPNDNIIVPAVALTMKSILQGGTLSQLSLLNAFEKKGDFYQLSADGIKSVAEPTADNILKPPPAAAPPVQKKPGQAPHKL